MTATLIPSVPVVSVECKEPEGTVIRHVYPMLLSMENLRTFWEKASQFRTLFTDDINGDFSKFCELFISADEAGVRAHGLFWVVDDFVGVFYLNFIRETEALCHYTFFDRRHFGREELTKAMLRHVFIKYGFQRLNVEVAAYASKHTFGFTHALGFVKEGRKRKCLLYKGDWFDVHQYGLLREEALKDAPEN